MRINLIFVMLFVISCQEEMSITDRSLPRVIEVIPHEYVISPSSEIELRFSRPLLENSVTTRNVQLGSGVKKSIPIKVEFLEGGERIKIVPVDSLDEKQDYIITLSSLIRDQSGRPLGNGVGQKGEVLVHFRTAEIAIVKSELHDDVPLLHEGNPEVSSMETHAVVKMHWNKPVKGRLWFGRVGERLNCLGQSCPIRFTGSEMTLTGLSSGEHYRYAIRAEDDAQHVMHFEGIWKNEKLSKIVINEVMAKPDASSTLTDSEVAFIELFNNSDEEVDLKDFSLLLSTQTGSWRSCMLDTWKVAAHAFVLLTGQRYKTESNLVYRMKTQQVCGPLSLSGQRIVLKDPKGRIVSSYGAYETMKAGMSMERIAPDALDESGNFCLSHSQIGPTPGRVNSAVAYGCATKRNQNGRTQ